MVPHVTLISRLWRRRQERITCNVLTKTIYLYNLKFNLNFISGFHRKLNFNFPVLKFNVFNFHYTGYMNPGQRQFSSAKLTSAPLDSLISAIVRCPSIAESDTNLYIVSPNMAWIMSTAKMQLRR